jgi:sulfur transfer complex TusBCD TusB component (DsrH family)
MKTNNILTLIMVIVLGSCVSIKTNKPTMLSHNPNYKELKSLNNDTLRYVKYNFYENQHFYTGKSLKVLFNDLEARIVSFTISSMINPIEKSDGVSLTIRYTKYEEEKTNYMKLIIKFDQLYDYDDALELYDSSADPNWGKAQEDFYKDFIVKEIFIYVPEEH